MHKGARINRIALIFIMVKFLLISSRDSLTNVRDSTIGYVSRVENYLNETFSLDSGTNCIPCICASSSSFSEQTKLVAFLKR